MEVINPKPRFVIEKCSLVTQWAWDTINDCCPICRNSVNEDSITNENNSELNSVVVVGMCGHAFHYECIDRWLKNSKNCPLCNSTWEYQKTMDKNKNESNSEEKNDSAEESKQDDSIELPSYSAQVNISLPPINVTSTNIGININNNDNNNGNVENNIFNFSNNNVLSPIPHLEEEESIIEEEESIIEEEESILEELDDNINLGNVNGHL